MMMMVMKESGNVYSSTTSSGTFKSKRLRRKPDQHFSSYISFGFSMTIFLAIVVVLYCILILYFVLVIFQGNNNPLRLSNNNDHSVNQLVKQPLTEKMKNAFDKFRHKVSDSQFVGQVQQEINQLRKARKVNSTVDQLIPVVNSPKDTKTRNGFIVLGMHRSGTSMLSGLLVTGMGYNVGEPLIGGAFDNEKGFFELIPVVLQNDEFLYSQQIDWSHDVYHYDYKKGLERANANLENGHRYFKEGRKALQFLNNAQNTPWLQKDPRMCITLKTWLPLLNTEPAIVWTFRHPMEVSHSLMSREKSFTLDHSLRLWIVYNMRALQNSVGLCRVYTSNEEVLKNPMKEVQRVSDELTRQCQVPKPPNVLTTEQVNKFVDTTLQHNTKSKYNDGPIIERHGTDCDVHELVTTTERTNPKYDLERKLYRLAMKMYCDLKSGAAYKVEYIWPDLVNL
jgi:hypothetical protein